jgi:hypothetical protein
MAPLVMPKCLWAMATKHSRGAARQYHPAAAVTAADKAIDVFICPPFDRPRANSNQQPSVYADDDRSRRGPGPRNSTRSVPGMADEVRQCLAERVLVDSGSAGLCPSPEAA